MAKKKNANGDGSLFYDSKKGIYRGSIVIGYDESGKMKRKTVSGKTPTEVKQKLKQIEYGIFSGEFVDKSNITIYHLAKQIIDDKLDMNEIKSSTYLRHIQTLKSMKQIYNIPLQKINEMEIRKYFHKRIAEASDSVLRKEYEMLNSTFKEAIRRDIITKNPIDYIKRPNSKQKAEEVRALTVEEQNKLLYILQTEDIKYSYQMILEMFTGMRMGEINALTIDDINFRFGKIEINKTVTVGEKGKAELSDSAKTYAGNRTIKMTDDVKTILAECVQLTDSDLLFPNSEGAYIRSNAVNDEFQRVLKQYDILDKSIKGKVTAHSLRHTYATRMIEGGMIPKVLQGILGHTDIRITLNTYCNAFDNLQEDNIELTNEYLKKNGLTLGIKKDGAATVNDKVKVS